MHTRSKQLHLVDYILSRLINISDADSKNYDKFYASIKAAYNSRTPSSTPVFSEHGRELLTSADDISRRWREYYEPLLNCESIEPNIANDLEQFPIDVDLTELPSNTEVKNAILSRCDEKAAGVDGIPAELCSRGGGRSIELYIHLNVSAGKVKHGSKASGLQRQCPFSRKKP